MVDHIDLEYNRLPTEEGFGFGGPNVLVTSVYLSRVKNQIRNGLSNIEEYSTFIEAYQMDLLQFFVVASEEIKERCRRKMANMLIKDSIHKDKQYNELALIEGLSEPQFWDLARHYELDVVVDGPGKKSIRDIIDLRNELVHNPDDFAGDPPSAEELVVFINSTLDIIEFLED